MKLYIYDHCPYCVKACMIFGLKNLPIELVTQLNDDEETPIKMIGQKMVPILAKSDGSYMAESLDIISYINDIDGNVAIKNMVRTMQVEDWLQEANEFFYFLCMPRWAEAPLEEFKTAAAKQYFIDKKEGYIGPFAEQMASSTELIKQANNHLRKLEYLLKSTNALNGELTIDDIEVYTILRGLSIVKGISYSKRVNEYRQNMAKLSKVPLLDEIAI